MRLPISCVLLLLSSVCAFGQFTVPQARRIHTGSGGPAIAFVSAVNQDVGTGAVLSTTAGNLIIITVNYNNAGFSPCADTYTVTDSHSDSFTSAANAGTPSSSFSCTEQWYGYASQTTSETFTVTWTGGPIAMTGVFVVTQWSGAVVSTPLDTTATGTATSGTTTTSGAFTTSTAKELILVSAGSYGDPGGWTAGAIGGGTGTICTGCTRITGTSTGNAAVEYLIVNATQSGITAAMSQTNAIAESGIVVGTYKSQ